jgi:hypothetical protein
MDTSEIKNQAPEIKPEKKCKFCLLSNRSKMLKIIIAAIGLILIILVSFAAGVGIALHKARFNCFRKDNMEHNMGGQMKERGPMGFFQEFEGRDFLNAHGLAGTITSISDNTFFVKDKDNKETTVAVNDQTIIRSQRNSLKIEDLKTDDQVVVMGQPGDNSVINATLIRVFRVNQGN